MTQKTAQICVVGSANVDLTFRAARLPSMGETFPGDSFLLGYGGKGANQAVMAARMGAQVVLIAKIGKDLFGKGIRANLVREGIDAQFVSEDSTRPTGVAAIMLDPEGRNSILLVGGANMSLDEKDLDQASAAIEAAD